jgi:hypothetical protein
MKVLIDGDSIAYKAAVCAADNPRMMRQVIDKEVCTIMAECETTDYELWIENPLSKNIFRNEIAVTKKYKGNRDGLERPTLLLEAKEYMVGWWNAHVTDVFEAEDMVVRRAYQEGLQNVVVAAVDKDLLGHPFTFYNYRTGEHFTVEEEEAECNLWRQVATGDSTDNIPGIPGVGKVKAGHIQNMRDCVMLYKRYRLTYRYFVEQYNLIYIRKENTTDVLYPLGKIEWSEV